MLNTQKPELTILVKKPDGTTERVALDIVLRRGTRSERREAGDEGRGTSDEKSVPSIQSPKPPTLQSEQTEAPDASTGTDRSLKSNSTALTTTTPVKNIFLDQAKAHTWDAEDHRSPLDEPLDLNRHSAPRLLPHDRNDEVEKVIRRSGLSIDPSLYPRLASMIQSRIKEIRTDDQVVAALHRSIEQGGIDCTAQEAEVILMAITEVCHLKTAEPKQTKKTAGIRPPIATPLSPLPKTPPRTLPVARSLASGAKPILHDIHPPPQSTPSSHVIPPTDLFSHTETVGPIDEIRGITLEHLRKLGNNQKERTERFALKFERLREEDIVGFLDAEEAWYQSPAYREYQQALRTSIKEHRPLFEVAKEQGMSEEDIDFYATIRRTAIH